MRRLGWLLLLPVIWVPVLVFVAMVAPLVPWWGWVFAVVFWFSLLRRRHAAQDPGVAAAVSNDGPRWSPTRGGGL